VEEIDLARRAVRKGLLTEDQLREARSYAAGGRSLVSELLDRGYLRFQDLPDLLKPPESAAPRRRVAGWLLTAALVGIACSLVLTSLSRPVERHRLPPAPPVAAPPEPAPGEAFVRRAQALLADCAAPIAEGRRGSPEVVRKLATAEALYLEALQPASGLVEPGRNAAVLGFALTREFLEKWEEAAAVYDEVLAKNPSHPDALLGRARMSLSLGKPVLALAMTDRLCRLSSDPPAEAYLLRGQAEAALGDRSAAYRDLDDAVRRDASLKARADDVRRALR
jgi:tetratricopeptide (TPR) repeat protein